MFFGVIRIEIGVFPWGDEVAGGAGAVPVRNVDIEALFEGRVRWGAKMPFAEVGGGVTGRFESFS